MTSLVLGLTCLPVSLLFVSPILTFAHTKHSGLRRCTVMTGVVGIFVPFSRTMDLVFAAGGCLLFSGYVIYDTYMITNRLSHDEHIAAAISLYIE